MAVMGQIRSGSYIAVSHQLLHQRGPPWLLEQGSYRAVSHQLVLGAQFWAIHKFKMQIDLLG